MEKTRSANNHNPKIGSASPQQGPSVQNQCFLTETWVAFHEADPAGILFFGRIFEHAHVAFEKFIQSSGMTWSDYFRTSPYLIPLRHVEADYHRPFLPGQFYSVEVRVQKIGQSSFTMSYTFTEHKNPDVIHAKVQTVHTVLDKNTRSKIPVPLEIQNVLQPFTSGETPA